MSLDDTRQRKQIEREAYKQEVREREGREPCLGELLYPPDLDQDFQSVTKLLHALIESKKPASVSIQEAALNLLVTLQNRLTTLVCLDMERANRLRDATQEHAEAPEPTNHAEPAETSRPAAPFADPIEGALLDVEIQHRALDVLQKLAGLASQRTRRLDLLVQAVEEAEQFLQAEDSEERASLGLNTADHD